MTKSEERAFEILKSQLDTEKRERLSEQKKRRAAELRSEGYEKELSELRRQLTSKIDDQSAMLSQLTQFLMGNGAVSLSDSLKDPIIGSIREEFEKREHALKDANEKRMEEMIDAFNRKLAAKDNEINRLKGRKKGRSSGDEGNMTGSIKAGMDFARLQSLFANIKNHTLNGMEYICDIFRRIKDTSEEEMENLLAHKWQPSKIVSNQF